LVLRLTNVAEMFLIHEGHGNTCSSRRQIANETADKHSSFILPVKQNISKGIFEIALFTQQTMSANQAL